MEKHALSVQQMSVLVFIITTPALPNKCTLSIGARKMEIPVRMNTTRPVSLCSLWGEGRVSQGLGEPLGCPGWRPKPDITIDPGRREMEGSSNYHLSLV